MQWQIEPMASWPYPETKGRKTSPFRAKHSDTLKKLDAELEHLQARGAVAVRVVATQADIRRDGMLRASARVQHPGVAISFTSARHGALTYPCDAFQAGYYGESWQANLRAIALGLEHLRALDRYGIAGHGEQYAGWRAIEAASKADGFASVDDAVRWLADFTGGSRHDGAADLLRRASRVAHPDRSGIPEDWARVDAARQLLKKAQVVA